MEFLKHLAGIAFIFVAFLVVLGPIISFLLDLFIPFDDFDDDDGYGF